MSSLLTVVCLLLALLTPPDPQLRAQWDGSDSATISWTQQTRGCLGVEHASGERAFVGCWEKPGTLFIELGHGVTDGSVRPQAHDIYVLQTQNQTYKTPLAGRNIYLPVFR